MNLRTVLAATAFALTCSLTAAAQAPVGAPAGATGQCKDGTYSNAPAKSGACAGHKGVAAWYTATAAKPATTAKPAATVPTSTAPAAAAAAATTAPKRSMPTPSATAAPGGGPGMVWVNTASNVYHCPGERYYGRTKAGKYMTEADAKAAGAHGEKNQTCSK